MNDDLILITEKDLVRIRNVLSYQRSDEFDDLEAELERARIISEEEVTPDLVTMNTKVRFLNVQEKKEMAVTVVYPSDANFAEGRVSVLAPLGSALIGLRVGQEIDWTFPDGKVRRLKILGVQRQADSFTPEDRHASG